MDNCAYIFPSKPKAIEPMPLANYMDNNSMVIEPAQSAQIGVTKMSMTKEQIAIALKTTWIAVALAKKAEPSQCSLNKAGNLINVTTCEWKGNNHV